MSAADRDPARPASPFPHLFSPLRVGSVTLRNRIFSSGHDTVMPEDGRVGDRLLAYHEARAAGGVGLIVVQATGIDEASRYTAHVLMASTDDCIPGFRRLADAVHAHGTAIFGQLFHGGREIMESADGSLPVALAPSSVPTERFHVMPRAMTQSDIDLVVAAYGAAAGRLRTAGLDGAEIVASHGYLPAQFLNPRANRREDGYGGNPERRLRFLREVIASVRSRTPRPFVLGMRISVEEITPEGLTADDVLPALAALDADGELDYVSVVAGTSATLAGSDHIVPPMVVPNAYTAPLAARVKATVRMPVLVTGRINQPQEAEQVIATGKADACGMTRALISDPLLPIKAAAGRLDEIRACVACNQACIGHFHADFPISCIQYPESGRELWYGTLAPTARPRDVLVVGAGPGGLKAAAVAAARGHRVTLYEAARRVGGQVLLAEKLPGRAEFGGVITNLRGEAERAGVRIVTGTRVDAGLVGRLGPDAVIVATGARPYRPPLELANDPVVLDAWAVIGGPVEPPGDIVVADFRCDWVGLGVAEMLALRGHRVTLASNGYVAGFRIQQYVRDTMMVGALRAHVTLLPLTRLFGYDGRAVILQHVLTEEAVIVDNVAALVLAQGHEPVADLVAELADFAGEVIAIGDALAPRTVEEAVLEGLRAGAAV